MIVNYKETGWEVITQRSHGLLAAQIGMHWKANDRPERWTETLIAIADHDDAEVELDGENLLTPAGGPLHFAMKTFELDHCNKMWMLTITKSRYVALLSSMHMEFLYRKDAQENEAAYQFLEEQKKMRQAWMKELGIDKKAIEKAYNFLEWCDAFSLLLCNKQLQPEKRGLEISTGPSGEVYQVFQEDEQLLTVKPWPFDTNTFKVCFESRDINTLQFESSTAFRKAFIEAPVKETVWTIHKKEGKVRRPRKT